MTPLSVCFVGLKCYDLLADVPKPRYFGGAERQQVLLARGLAARGHDVSFVTLDYGQDDGTVHGGIRVLLPEMERPRRGHAAFRVGRVLPDGRRQ